MSWGIKLHLEKEEEQMQRNYKAACFLALTINLQDCKTLSESVLPISMSLRVWRAEQCSAHTSSR